MIGKHDRVSIHGANFDDMLQCTRHGDVVTVSLWYPRCDDNAKIIEIDLVDVRAADSIRIQYDFDRDGYAISQARRTEMPVSTGEEQDQGWTEVAFIKAWALCEDKDDQ